MKKLITLLAVLFISVTAFLQSIGINSTGAAPTSGAMLEVKQDGTSKTAYFYNSNEDDNGGNGVHIQTWNNSNDKYALKVTSEDGNIEGLTVTNYGHVGIGITSPETELDVNGVALSNFEGFSYYAEELYVAGFMWQDLIIDTEDYNTFANTPYNTSNGTFTAPRDGYYRFSIFGVADTEILGEDQSYLFGVKINNVLKSIAGGNYLNSPLNPLTTYSAVVYLSAGDVVKPAMFSSIDVTLGPSEYDGHQFWFKGEFVGK